MAHKDSPSKDISRGSSFRIKNFLKPKRSHTSVSDSSVEAGAKVLSKSRSFNTKRQSAPPKMTKSTSVPTRLSTSYGNSTVTDRNELTLPDIIPVSSNRSVSILNGLSKRNRHDKLHGMSTSSIDDDTNDMFYDDEYDNTSLGDIPIQVSNSKLPRLKISRPSERSFESGDDSVTSITLPSPVLKEQSSSRHRLGTSLLRRQTHHSTDENHENEAESDKGSTPDQSHDKSTDTTHQSGLLYTIMNTLNFRSHSDLHEMLNDKPEDTTASPNTTETDQLQMTATSEKENEKPDDKRSQSPSPAGDVQFKPLKPSLLSTLGQGALTLDNFPKQSNGNSEQTTLTNNNGVKSNGLINNSSSVVLANSQPMVSSHSLRSNIPFVKPDNTNAANSSTVGEQAAPHSQYLTFSNSQDDRFSRGNSSIVKRALSPIARRTFSPTAPMRDGTSSPPLEKFGSSNGLSKLNSNADSSSFEDDADLVNGMASNNNYRRKLRLSIKRNSFGDGPGGTNGKTQALSRYSSNVDEDSMSAATKKRADKLAESLGIKVCSEKRQESFHQLFPQLKPTEILIEDFTCAFRKEILIQGKLYVSEYNLSFHSNIIGLVTHFSIPLNKVLSIKKKKTVGIPNAIELSTLHDKYTFATLINRDSAYELLRKVLTNALKGINTVNLNVDDSDMGSEDPLTDESEDSDGEDEADQQSSVAQSHALQVRGSSRRKASFSENGGTPQAPNKSSAANGGNGADSNSAGGGPTLTTTIHTSSSKKTTTNGNASDSESESSVSDPENMIKDDLEEGGGSGTVEKGEDGTYYGLYTPGPMTHAPTSNDYDNDSSDTKIIDEVVNAPLGAVYSLLFGDDVKFLQNLIKVQKNFDISDIPKFDPATKKRVYTYTKPLNSPVGPKQTRCNVTETIEAQDFNKCCFVIQSTETPDVPSGNVFRVRTKMYFSWAANNATKVFIVTTVVWSGKSWIKGPVEKGTISGQKESLGILVSELKKKIQAALASGGSGKTSKTTKKVKRRRETRELVEHVPELAAPAVEQSPKPNSIWESIVDQMDLRTIITVVLLFIVLWDKIRGPSLKSLQEQIVHSGEYGVGGLKFSSTSKLSSEVDLWDWINSRSGYDSEDSNRHDIRNSALQEQELREVIRVSEQRIQGLKDALNG